MNRLICGVAMLLLIQIETEARLREIGPEMEQGQIVRVLQDAGPGDTILFREGCYKGGYRLEDLHGEVNRPIIFLGEGPGRSIIDGEVLPGTNLKHNAFRLKNCSWISIEGFTIKNCWLDLVRAGNSSYISLRSCDLHGGKRALFANGRGSHHFLVEDCRWEQDERVWNHEGDYSWEETHHGIHQHYNGSLFQGSGISGVFVLRDNTIRNTYNAFRLSQINEGSPDPLACTNGEVYRNTVFNTADNVLEPEVHVLNLHFYHNTMINGHAFISITEVLGGELYVYGNTAMSMPDSDDGWTVFKISCISDSLSLPFYIFNNSWQVDFDMIGRPREIWENSHIRHFNNACFSLASDIFGIYSIGLDNSFDHDCSNVPFPSILLSAGHEKNGIVADPLFRDPLAMDFRLKENSPCIDKGKKDERLIPSFLGEAPDIGAYEGEHRVEGPAFRYMDPELEVPFIEHPRITRVKANGKKIELCFSMPMDAQSLEGTGFLLRDGEQEYVLTNKILSKDGYTLSLSGTEASEFVKMERRNISLQLSRWPLGKNGQALSSWASEINVNLAN
jgi:hypothetical protein